MANERLIREVVKDIEADRKHWNQNWFAHVPQERTNLCGTQMCFAGFALCRVLGRDEYLRRSLRWSALSRWVLNSDYDVEGEAAKALGLSLEDAHSIFFSTYDNNIETLKAKITEVTGITFD